MEPLTIGLLALGILFVLLIISVPIGVAMAACGVLGVAAIIGLKPALALFGNTVYETTANFDLSIIPLFVLMGSVAQESVDAPQVPRSLPERVHGEPDSRPGCSSLSNTCCGINRLAREGIPRLDSMGSLEYLRRQHGHQRQRRRLRPRLPRPHRREWDRLLAKPDEKPRGGVGREAALVRPPQNPLPR